jgi:Cu2+-exporting ATPase
MNSRARRCGCCYCGANLCRGKRQDVQRAKEDVATMTNNDPRAAATTDHQHVPVRRGTFELRGVYCLGCAGAVERVLREQPHITDVHLDWKSDVVHVGYDPANIGPEDIEQVITQTGCDCKPTEIGEEHHHEAMAPPERRMQHLGHGVDTQPISMGTKHDRMQYEMPATHADHGDRMDHDISDPNMAATMERDMRNKFFVALLLTIPTVLYSPLGMNLLGLRLPTFGLGENVIMLLLSTPVVFYSGWIFISGAYHSLQRRTLNMSVLIATGVLAAYLFSVLITFLGGETFYEAAAMLVTFVLFGHWMEMRSRRGTNDALRALFDLVPPQATVIRDGEEMTIPSSEVRLGDTVVLRPGDKVPVDGEVTEGETSIDEALVTGESVPVTKRLGDGVIAGSINRSGSIRFWATAVGADTTLAQIVDLVQQAQNSKAPGQRLADRAAEYLVILAVGSGIVTFLAWYFLGGRCRHHGDDVRDLGRRHRLPRRSRPGHPDRCGCGHRHRSQTQYPDQRCSHPRERLACRHHRSRQDRHAHRGRTLTHRRLRSGWQE